MSVTLSSTTNPKHRTRFVPKKKSTIESEPSSPTSTEKSHGSPCRQDFSCKTPYNYCFRTGETDNLYEEYDFCQSYTEPDGDTPLQEQASALPKTRAIVLQQHDIETQRLRFAILAKIGGSASGPSSPRYDRWNSGYTKLFIEICSYTSNNI